MSDTSTHTKTFLVTGGAGFLGINLIRYLLKQNQHVVSLDIADFTYPEKDQITVIHGDVRDAATMTKALEGVDVVVHSAAALPLYSPEEIYSTNVDGTRVVLETARAAQIDRVVHVSSTAVYGIPDHHPLLETDELQGVGPYGVSKVDAEKVCEEFRAKGMCVPIVRPKSFIGPERLGVFALLYDWAKSGKNFPVLGRGKTKYQLLDVEDLCEAIYLVSMKPCEIANDTFNIGAKEFNGLREDFQAVLDEAGFNKKIIAFPATPVIWVLKVLEYLHLSPLYEWVYETASKDSFVSIEKAERVLGFSPRFSNQDALLRNYRWYLEHEKEFSQQSGVSHRVPWKQGILGLLKILF